MGPEKMTDGEIGDRLASMPGWSIKDEKLHKDFRVWEL